MLNKICLFESCTFSFYSLNHLKVLEKCGLDEASPLTYNAGFWLSYKKENLN